MLMELALRLIKVNAMLWPFDDHYICKDESH